MPIVSAAFDYKRPQRNGTWRCRERHTDDQGRHYYFRYTAQSEAEADALLAGRDAVPSIAEREEQEMFDHIEAGGTPDSYVASELSTVQKRRRALRRFMQNDISDRRFLCAFADFVSGFTAEQIATAADISEAAATRVLNRAVRLRDTICPALALDDQDVR